MTEKAKTAKDVLDKKAPTASIPIAAARALQFLRAGKTKARTCDQPDTPSADTPAAASHYHRIPRWQASSRILSNDKACVTSLTLLNHSGGPLKLI